MSGGTWFTSDLHVGHSLVARHRAAAGLCPETEHDDVMAENWDARVRTGDLVWVLGDLTLGTAQDALDWMEQRPGRKRLILGNHDEIHPMHRGAPQRLHRASWLRTFEFVATMARVRIAGHRVLLSHFPYQGSDRADDTRSGGYDQYRLPNLGTPLIHGHTHSAAKLTLNRGTAQVHVGMDAWGLAPAALRDVEDLLTGFLGKAAA